MTINMEVKKHKLEQLQNGSWKITFTVHSDDMSMEVIQAAMGAPYGLAMVPIDYDYPDTPIRVSEKSEGEKVLALSHIRCKDKEFQEYMRFDTGDEGMWYEPSEKMATQHLYDKCNIKSRSELITDVAAQKKFRELDQKFKKWWADKEWETINQDNLDREG